MNLTTNHLQSILSSLSRDSFNQFIFELWQIDNRDTAKDFIGLKRKPRLGSGVLEQYFVRWDIQDGSKSHQGFNLIVPFFQPAEALLQCTETNDLLHKEIQILKKFDRTLKRRVRNWYWPQDGQFSCSSIYFVSNLVGIEKINYQKKILPKLSEIIEPFPYITQVGIGTYDSFIDRVPQKTEKVLKELFSKSQLETSLFLQDGRVFIEQHLPENFLQSGVLPKSLNPCDTVIRFPSNSNLEIIKEFETLINKDFKEGQLEKFLTRYYKQIFGPNYDRIEPQLWLRFPELDINRKERRLDIFLRNAIERDWELIELKAKGKIVSFYRDVPTFSAKITGAISQLRNYERILQQDNVKKKMHQHGIEYYEPQLRLVIGGKPEVSVEQWRRIKHENEKGLKIITYDDIIAEMKLRQSAFESIYKETSSLK